MARGHEGTRRILHSGHLILFIAAMRGSDELGDHSANFIA